MEDQKEENLITLLSNLSVIKEIYVVKYIFMMIENKRKKLIFLD